MLTTDELAIINVAIDAAVASAKRQQNAKPRFKAVFEAEANELLAIRAKLNAPQKQK